MACASNELVRLASARDTVAEDGSYGEANGPRPRMTISAEATPGSSRAQRRATANAPPVGAPAAGERRGPGPGRHPRRDPTPGSSRAQRRATANAPPVGAPAALVRRDLASASVPPAPAQAATGISQPGTPEPPPRR